MKFKPRDLETLFKNPYPRGFEGMKPHEYAAHFINNKIAEMLEEDCRKANRLSSWPITRERYRQMKAKMRRFWNRIQELEKFKQEAMELAEHYSKYQIKVSSFSFEQGTKEHEIVNCFSQKAREFKEKYK